MSYQNVAFFWCGVLEAHGCVLLSEDVSFDYKANKIARDDTLRSSTRAHGQTASSFWLCRTFARRQSESAPIRSKHVQGALASSHVTDRRAKSRFISYGCTIHLQIGCRAALAGHEDRRTADLLKAGSSQQRTAAAGGCPTWGLPEPAKPESGLPEAAGHQGIGAAGAAEGQTRCSSTSRRRSPFPTV